MSEADAVLDVWVAPAKFQRRFQTTRDRRSARFRRFMRAAKRLGWHPSPEVLANGMHRPYLAIFPARSLIIAHLTWSRP